MNETLQPIVSALEERFGAQVHEFRGDVNLTVSPDNLVETCRVLRDEFGFDMLTHVTAVDYWPELEPRFHSLYQILSVDHNLMLRLRVPLNGNSPHVPTIEKIYPNANWYEREIWDMFGITVDGHSDPRRILMPQEWVGHPLRKDYPLGYEEVRFTFNYDEVDRRKPLAKE